MTGEPSYAPRCPKHPSRPMRFVAMNGYSYWECDDCMAEAEAARKQAPPPTKGRP